MAQRVSLLDGGAAPRTVLHASGFVSDGWPTSVYITSYVGDLEDVVPGIVEKIRSQGHEVTIRRTRPLGDWWLVAVDLVVTVNGPETRETPAKMWHHFTYPAEQWQRE